MTTHLKKHEAGDTKIPFSQLVGKAVDDLGLRDHYKGADDVKIAKHVKALMQVLRETHEMKKEKTASPKQEKISNAIEIIDNGTHETTAINTSLQVFTANNGLDKFYAELPKIMRSNPNISARDRLLCLTIMDLMIELKFNVEDDVALQADMVTEMLTTTRVPDRKEVRHYIDKKREESVGFADRNKQSGRLGVEKIFESDVKHIPGNFGIDPKFRNYDLNRIVIDKENKLSHTPFEYFHSFEDVRTNKKDKPIYLLRTNTHWDTSREKTGSIVTFLDQDYNFLNPSFPVIDDPENNNFILNNAFCNYNIGRYAGGLFFKYKYKLFLIKNGKYVRPPFAQQIDGEKFYYIKDYEKKAGYYEVHTKDNTYLTDNYFRVLGKSVEEVKKLLAKPKK
ncbi:MAG: hypothetical protein NTY80_02960 [candidate division SR1 bacterium]|nr:hypothetical protein [candidate division SR1 bacterium]